MIFIKFIGLIQDSQKGKHEGHGAVSREGWLNISGSEIFWVGELDEAMSVMENLSYVSNQVIYNLKKREIERDIFPFLFGEEYIYIRIYPFWQRGPWPNQLVRNDEQSFTVTPQRRF
ncbi:MAG: hypothetical protein Ct9H300mP27_10440 [Chloroflexota bacterium]|nr:MAG: hypothetical protein Ct9H300mP27_10440 [Chloroflexota bacterium]